MSDHELAKLPEISASNNEPGLFEHQLVKIEVRYPCKCGVTVRASEALSETSAVTDPRGWADMVRQVTARGRDAWDEHTRG